MSKRTNDDDDDDDDDEEKHEIVLTFDIWTNIFIQFDDLPLIEIDYPVPTTSGSHYTLKKSKILLISNLLNLSLVCKMFKEVVESKDLLLKWQDIFIFNLGDQLGILSNDKLFDIHVNLLRYIVITNNIINNKKKYMGIKHNKHNQYHEMYEGIGFIKFQPNRYFYTDEIKKDNIHYENDIKNMKIYIRTLRSSIKKREDKCNNK